MKEEILKLNNLRKKASLGGGKEKVQAQHNKGKLTAIERINELIEEETFTTYEPYPTDNYFLNRKKDKLTTYRYSKYMRYNRWQAELIERS